MIKKIEIIKNDKGAISTIVLVTILFFLTMLSTAYMVNVAHRKGQLESQLTTKKVYEKEFDEVENIINKYEEKEKLPSTKGTEPYYPSEKFKQVPGTDLDNGLVIKDVKGNEYVWIEVPNDGTGPNYKAKNVTGPTDYANIEAAIKEYTSEYRTNYDDVYYADATEGWFTDATSYNNAKNKMLKSVYENGGFYIGRYEVGIEKNRTASGKTIVEPMSKPNLYPYNYVTRTQAKVLAEKLSTAEYTNTLMFGMQWDLVLKYLETKGVAQADLKTNSTNWGNYKDATFPIDNTKAKKSEDDGAIFTELGASYTKPANKGVLLTTGADKRNSKQNIYDLAGNVCEWTLEKTTNTDKPCNYRGGYHSSSGTDRPVAVRGTLSMSYNNSDIGFRFSLYK